MPIAALGHLERAEKHLPEVARRLSLTGSLRFASLSNSGQAVIFAKDAAAADEVKKNADDIVRTYADVWGVPIVKAVRAVVADSAHLVLLEMVRELIHKAPSEVGEA